MSEQSGDGYGMRQRAGLFLGPVVFLIILLIPAPGGLASEAWAVAGVVVFMAIWWVTEAIPIPATALLPIILFPILEVGTVAEATRPFANPLIYLLHCAQCGKICGCPSDFDYHRIYGRGSLSEYVGEQYGYGHDDAADSVIHNIIG